MRAKEYLSRAFLIAKKIEARQKQLEFWKNNPPYATPVISDMPKGTSSVKSMIEEHSLRVMDLENLIASMMEELSVARKESESLIASINDPQSETLLEMRYLSFMSWDNISSVFGITARSVFRLHSQALDKCDAVLSRRYEVCQSMSVDVS